jgi:hypothetical protein
MDATGAPLTPTGISPLIALFPPATRIPPLSPPLPPLWCVRTAQDPFCPP